MSINISDESNLLLKKACLKPGVYISGLSDTIIREFFGAKLTETEKANLIDARKGGEVMYRVIIEWCDSLEMFNEKWVSKRINTKEDAEKEAINKIQLLNASIEKEKLDFKIIHQGIYKLESEVK